MPSLLRGPWRLILALLAVLAGTAWQLQQAAVLAPVDAGALAAAALAGAGWAWLAPSAGWRMRPALRACTGLLALGVLAFALCSWRAQDRLADRLLPDLEGADLLLTGTIAGLPRVGPEGSSFELAAESAVRNGHGVDVPSLVRLSWITGWDGEALLAAPPSGLIAGDRWQLPVRLRQPHGVLNPHGFDLELWMFERGVRATGSVRPGAQQLGSSWRFPFDRLRQRLRDAILQRVPDESAAGVLAALAVGDQAAIQRDDWDVFRITGVAHLMSISGLHITMFAWLAAAVLKRLWRRWPRAALAVPAPDAARWGGLALAAMYALVAGWGVPAQRTVGMLAAVALLQAAGRRWPWPLIWLVAGTAVVVWDPWALLQPGFWLSFVAVGVLMASEPAAGTPPRVGWWPRVRAGLHTQWVATVALAPLSMVFFQQVSVVGAVSNLLAIPWVTLVVTPLALAGALMPVLWSLGAAAVQGLTQALSLAATWPLAQWNAAAAPAWAVAAGLFGGALLVLPLPWRLRGLGVPLMLPLLAPVPPLPAEGELHIVAADVGQGTAVLVRTRRHLLVYDAGPRYSPQCDAAGRVLLPLLRARGETVIDQLVLSHRDSDHIGGAQALLSGVTVRSSLSSLEPGHPLVPRLPRHSRCSAGQQWWWDGVHFEVLHPMPGELAPALKPNALSCVIRVSDRHGPRLLLTGDIEAAQEAELVARLGQTGLQTPLLMLPHHGSATSSSELFLDAVAPGVGMAQAAYRSRFGHPAPVVQQRLAQRGTHLVRSDTCGAWQWPQAQRPETLEAATFDPGFCERVRHRRYWHHPGEPGGAVQSLRTPAVQPGGAPATP